MNTLKQIIINLFLSAVFFLVGIVAVVCAIAYLDMTHDEPSPKVYIILFLILGVWAACFKEAINILRFIKSDTNYEENSGVDLAFKKALPLWKYRQKIERQGQGKTL